MEIKIIFPGGATMSCPSKESAQAALGNYHFPPAAENDEGSEQESVPSTNVERAHAGTPGGRPHEGESFQAAIANIPDSEHLTESEELGYTENDDRDPPSQAISSNRDSFVPNFEPDEQSVDSTTDDETDAGYDPYSQGPSTARSVSMYEYGDFDNDDRIDSSEEPNQSDETGTLNHLVGNRNTRSRHSASFDGKKRWVPLPGINAILAPAEKMNKRTRKIYEFVRERLVFTTKEVRKFAKKKLGLKMNRKNRKKVRKSLNFLEEQMIIENVGWDDVQGTNWRKAS